MTPTCAGEWWRESLARRGQDPERWDADPAARPVLGEEDDVAALCVLARFELDAYVRGLVAMLAVMSSEERHRWYRAFTRVVLLAGQPRKIAPRHSPDAGDSGVVAWFRPRPRAAADPLSRLLALYAARAPASGVVPRDSSLRLAAGATSLDVRLEVDQMTIAECMIHLAHCVAEPWASGAWDGAGVVRVRCLLPRAEDVARADYVRFGSDASGARHVVGASRVIGGRP